MPDPIDDYRSKYGLSPATATAIARYGTPDTTAIYSKNGHRDVDTPRRDAGGHVPTHNVDVPSGRLPTETWSDYENRVLARTAWGPDTASSRDLSQLEPAVRDSTASLLEHAQHDGVSLTPIETRRTQARQEMLFQKGRSQPGPVVTWTLTSDHTPGRAVDFAGDPAALAWLQRNAPTHGFSVLGAMDPGHVALPVFQQGPAPQLQADTMPTPPNRPFQPTTGPTRPPMPSPAANPPDDAIAAYRRKYAIQGSSAAQPPDLDAKLAKIRNTAKSAGQPASGAVAPESLGYRLAGAAANIGAGATFGATPKIAAALHALYDKGTGGSFDYSGQLAEIRSAMSEFQKAHPAESTVEQVAGSVPTMIATGGIPGLGAAAEGAGIGAQLFRAGAQGAAFGGVAGALSQDQGPKSWLQGGLAGAQRGAEAGVILGGEGAALDHAVSTPAERAGVALISRLKGAGEDPAAIARSVTPGDPRVLGEVSPEGFSLTQVAAKQESPQGRSLRDMLTGRDVANTAARDVQVADAKAVADKANLGLKAVTDARGVQFADEAARITAGTRDRVAKVVAAAAPDIRPIVEQAGGAPVAQGASAMDVLKSLADARSASVVKLKAAANAAHPHGIDDAEVLALLHDRPVLFRAAKAGESYLKSMGIELPTADPVAAAERAGMQSEPVDAAAGSTTLRTPSGGLPSNLSKATDQQLRDEFERVTTAHATAKTAPTIIQNESSPGERPWVGAKPAAMKARGANAVRSQTIDKLSAEMDRRGIDPFDHSGTDFLFGNVIPKEPGPTGLEPAGEQITSIDHLHAIDRAVRALKDKVASQTASTRETMDAAAASDALGALRARLQVVAPEHAAMLADYSERSRQIDALTTGMNIDKYVGLKGKPPGVGGPGVSVVEQNQLKGLPGLLKAQAGQTPDQTALMQTGAVDKTLQMLDLKPNGERGASDAVLKLPMLQDGPHAAELRQVLYGPDGAKQVEAALTRERAMGSATTPSLRKVTSIAAANTKGVSPIPAVKPVDVAPAQLFKPNAAISGATPDNSLAMTWGGRGKFPVHLNRPFPNQAQDQATAKFLATPAAQLLQRLIAEQGQRQPAAATWNAIRNALAARLSSP